MRGHTVRLETGARIKIQKIQQNKICNKNHKKKKSIGVSWSEGDGAGIYRKNKRINWNYTSHIICKCILFSCSSLDAVSLVVRLFSSLGFSRFFRPDKHYLYLHWPSSSSVLSLCRCVCVGGAVCVCVAAQARMCWSGSWMRQVKRVTTHVVALVENDYEILCARNTCWRMLHLQSSFFFPAYTHSK